MMGRYDDAMPGKAMYEVPGAALKDLKAKLEKAERELADERATIKREFAAHKAQATSRINEVIGERDEAQRQADTAELILANSEQVTEAYNAVRAKLTAIEALKERWRASGEEGEQWMADELETVLKEEKR